MFTASQEIRIEEICHQVEKSDLKKAGPDVIMIHGGTNDIRAGISATEIMGYHGPSRQYKETDSYIKNCSQWNPTSEKCMRTFYKQN
jgi:lysophospholipase L1-like esterase